VREALQSNKSQARQATLGIAFLVPSEIRESDLKLLRQDNAKALPNSALIG
jgi:hypothetical protein